MVTKATSVCVSEIDDRVIGIDGKQHGRVVGNMGKAGKADCQEPQRGYRSEDIGHLAGTETLHRKQNRQNDQGDRHDIRIERRRHHFQALDRRQYRNRRRNDGVAEEQRRAADTGDQDRSRSTWIGAARERHQGQCATLAAVVGAQHENNVFNGDDNRQRPDYERQHAEHVVAGGNASLGRRVERFAERIDRAGADVAENDTECTKHQNRQTMLARRILDCRLRAGFSTAARIGICHIKLLHPELAGCDSPVATQKQWFRYRGSGASNWQFAYQPQAFRNRRTVSGIPYSSASAVKPWPIDTSASRGIRLASAGRLATVRS